MIDIPEGLFSLELTTKVQEPLQFIPAGDPPPGERYVGDSIPAEQRDQVILDVVHDGNWLPKEFTTDKHGNEISFKDIEGGYIRERDWGASLVAWRLCSQLRLDGFHRVNLARVLMDFGRFPGSTPRHADHLHRYAINFPFSNLLGYRQKKRVLEHYYDAVSNAMDRALLGKLIKIGIHTYDRYNESGTERPPVSILTRSIGYQTESEMPWGLFDPLYPDILGEFTAARILRDRISLTLEKANIPVAHNYPYCLPEGSLEVRYQVWSFFQFLRKEWETEFPETANDPAFEMVWEMLTDTNLRSSESDTLRSYLHMFRHAPNGKSPSFVRAADAYEALQRYVHDRKHHVVEHYRFAPDRPSALGIEIRKDVACHLGPDGKAVAPNWKNICLIADTAAQAITRYLTDDQIEPEDGFARTHPWYYPRGD